MTEENDDGKPTVWVKEQRRRFWNPIETGVCSWCSENDCHLTLFDGSPVCHKRPQWAHVASTFGCGSTRARELCERFELDPDAIVGFALDDRCEWEVETFESAAETFDAPEQKS